MKRKIIAVTGIRSEYDILKPVLEEIENHSELVLGLIVTGAHLSENYGYSVREIEEDGYLIEDRIECLINSDSLSGRSKTLGVLIQGLTQSVQRINPDILLVVGDREESIGVAIVGTYLNIPVAHIFGGDRVVGNIDDSVRHAVTKLAHIHFPTLDENAERIRKLGEQSFRIHNCGNPGLDKYRTTEDVSLEELSRVLDFDITFDPYIILIQHPLSSEVNNASEQMRTTLEAIKKTGIKTLVSYPNSDSGSQKIIEVIKEYQAEVPHIKTYKNLSRKYFVNLMRHASLLLGNSSCGILEAPLIKLPVINIGNRQKQRAHAENVVFVPSNTNEIAQKITYCLRDIEFQKRVAECKSIYGQGDSGVRIAKVLSEIDIDDILLNKEITY